MKIFIAVSLALSIQSCASRSNKKTSWQNVKKEKKEKKKVVYRAYKREFR